MPDDDLQHDDTAFHRKPAPGPRDGELRGMVSMDLLAKLDAIAQAENKGRTRMDIVEEVMMKYCDDKIHAAKVLMRMVGGNPSLSEPVGKLSERAAA